MIEGVNADWDNGLAVIGAGAIVNLNYAAAGRSTKGAPTKPFRNPENGKASGKMAAWGANNLYPQDRTALIEKDTELPSLLQLKVGLLAGSHLLPFKISGYTEKGQPIYVSAADVAPEATAFCSSRKTMKWLRESAVDLNYFFNTFPELILSRDRQKITDIYCQEATDCRWSEMNDQGQILHCFINGDMENYKEDYTTVVDVLQKDRSDVIETLKTKGAFKYIYPVSYPTPGRKYYQMPHHDGFFESGWYDVALAIPQFKKYLMENQMQLKYHVEVDASWWETNFPGFKDKSAAEKKEIMAAQLKKFNDYLTGAKNANKTLLTTMFKDEQAKMQWGQWRVTAIKDPEKDGKYIEDSQEASMHKLRALGLDPALAGQGPGRDNNSAGSGSDKWAAIKIYLANLGMMRQTLLEPLKFVFEYNGWAEQGLVPLIVDHEYFTTNTASELAGNPNPGSTTA